MPLHNIIGSSTWNGRRNKIRKSFTFVFLEPRSLCSISQSRAGSCFCTFFALLGSVYSALISTIIPLTFCLVLSQLAPCSTTCKDEKQPSLTRN
ncbi:hypothetical protein BDN71DRAFT_309972 [Pleurotus eryngii]|uniref:Uncharacterized protein n=1 Tax=Pleurotus eryngii TaxID=5323 RepID=A0A9P6A4F6_PLEER|nr:hypothetical protein BDN71DRAFT_309972 [Pleurotus eryngii]